MKSFNILNFNLLKELSDWYYLKKNNLTLIITGKSQKGKQDALSYLLFILRDYNPFIVTLESKLDRETFRILCEHNCVIVPAEVWSIWSREEKVAISNRKSKSSENIIRVIITPFDDVYDFLLDLVPNYDQEDQDEISKVELIQIDEPLLPLDIPADPKNWENR
jgi:hypothetical protein